MCYPACPRHVACAPSNPQFLRKDCLNFSFCKDYQEIIIRNPKKVGYSGLRWALSYPRKLWKVNPRPTEGYSHRNPELRKPPEFRNVPLTNLVTAPMII